MTKSQLDNRIAQVIEKQKLERVKHLSCLTKEDLDSLRLNKYNRYSKRYSHEPKTSQRDL